MFRFAIAIALLICGAGSTARGGDDVVVHLPEGSKAASAVALAPSLQPGEEGRATEGKADGQTVSFSSLAPATPFDMKIMLENGVILHGVNMAWYTREPAKPDAEAINDDDRRQIAALVSDVKSFYNISRVITLGGDHDRATVLVERIRSSDFHSDGGGEVIWRVELWYFTNDFGGWAEATQSNKVLRRERFKTNGEYRALAKPIRWVPILGGVVIDKTGAARQITITADAIFTAD